jgi:hypothetical protein
VRLWTLHPKYLDARGLVALWREGLLDHEWRHLLRKLRKRSPHLYARSRGLRSQGPQQRWVLSPACAAAGQ